MKKVVEIYHRANKLKSGFKPFRVKVLEHPDKGMRFAGYEFSPHFSYHWTEPKASELTFNRLQVILCLRKFLEKLQKTCFGS